MDNLFDSAMGMGYCGGMESLFQKVVSIFVDSFEERKTTILENLENKNWYDFTVAVHGLKSTSLTVGAQPLSKLALELEMLGKKMQNHEDEEATEADIRSKMDAFFDTYSKTLEEMKSYLG